MKGGSEVGVVLWNSVNAADVLITLLFFLFLRFNFGVTSLQEEVINGGGDRGPHGMPEKHNILGKAISPFWKKMGLQPIRYRHD